VAQRTGALDYGCFCVGEFAPVAGAGTGPLSGLTFAVKDLIDMRGTVSGAGNPDWRRTHAPADTYASAVQALLNSGARLVGRTISDELAFSLEGENHFEGHARQSALAGPPARRLVEWLGGRGRRQPCGFCARHRYRRLGARAGRILRHLRNSALFSGSLDSTVNFAVQIKPYLVK
jgi:hypothetical protein